METGEPVPYNIQTQCLVLLPGGNENTPHDVNSLKSSVIGGIIWVDSETLPICHLSKGEESASVFTNSTASF